MNIQFIILDIDTTVLIRRVRNREYNDRFDSHGRTNVQGCQRENEQKIKDSRSDLYWQDKEQPRKQDKEQNVLRENVP